MKLQQNTMPTEATECAARDTALPVRELSELETETVDGGYLRPGADCNFEDWLERNRKTLAGMPAV